MDEVYSYGSEYEFDYPRRRRDMDDLDILLLTDPEPQTGPKGVLATDFDLHSYTDYQCKKYFRFHTPNHLEYLRNLLQMPDMMWSANGDKASGLEVLCIVLRRLAYPNRFVDLCAQFPREESAICQLFNTGLDHIHSTFHGKVTDLNQPWLDLAHLQMYANVIAASGAPLNNCWGFIDGTVRPICRPSVLQKELYNGHKRLHGIKFQCVVTPNGLIANMYGPMPGRRHDAALLKESGLLRHMEENFNINGHPLCLYGDPAYPSRPHLSRPFLGHNLTPEQQHFNTRMAAVRQTVEWGFGAIIENWAFLDFKKNLKLFHSPVGKLYIVAAFLTNCLSCMYPWQGNLVNAFGINPPTIEEYLA